MMSWRSLILPFTAVGIACTEPTARQPWISGAWAVADTFEVQYTVLSDGFGHDTVTFQFGGYRTVAMYLTPVDTNAMRREVAGRYSTYSRSSAMGNLWISDDSLNSTDTLRVTAMYIYGQYVSQPAADSLALPPVETSDIYWNADTEALCNEERAGFGNSNPNVVPGSFSCRLRVHWRRP
jgi:hypothetical protein